MEAIQIKRKEGGRNKSVTNVLCDAKSELMLVVRTKRYEINRERKRKREEEERESEIGKKSAESDWHMNSDKDKASVGVPLHRD